jgi:uncharacterized protein involved in exopolysaccharide biosynthesis
VNRYIFEILHVLFKHKRIVLVIFLAIVVSVAAGISLRPDLYRAPGRIMITGQRAYFRLSPTDSRPSSGAPDLRDINTEIENIKSTAFLIKVVKALPFPLTETKKNGAGTPQEEQGILTRAASTVRGAVSSVVSLPSRVSQLAFSLFASEDSRSSQFSQEELSPELRSGVAALRMGLAVTAVPNSTLVEISFTDMDSRKAAVIVNTILEAYPKHQASLQQDPIALAFYDKQKQQLAREITEIETKLKEFEEREDAVALNDQKQQVLGLLDKTKDRLKGADLDIEQGLGKITKIERELAVQPETIVQSQERADPEGKLLQERLTILELEKNELLQRYTEKDRRVQTKETEMAAIREKLTLAGQGKIVIGEKIAPNPIRQDMLRELAEQKIKLGQIYPKRETLARHVVELHNELEMLNAKTYEHERMAERLKNRKDVYALYNKKAEEARISSAMDQEDLVNVKITDRAQVPMTPLDRNTALLLALAAIVGVGASVGGVLTLEYIRPTFHSELDVERHLQLPVLALIPDLREET